MEAYNEKKPLAPFLILLILLFIVALVGCALVFDVVAPWEQTNKAPAVSVDSGSVYIFKDRNCEYTLFVTYVFSNKGKTPVSFDACYDVSAQMNGTACPKMVQESRENALGLEDDIDPGRTVALSVGFVLKNFVPGKSTDISIRLYDRFDEHKLIRQADYDAVNLSVKEEKQFCKIC
ncbi:MAG: DUF5067 domain-containing protein [Oscillospiraceae bacterium]|nr:DUF5067 domain-containing protein [Oscillospiraceae bacterium]